MPNELHEGYVKGLKARGGFELEISWADMQVKTAHIKSLCGSICMLTAIEGKRIVCDNVEVDIRHISKDVWEFETIKGKIYSVS